MHDVKDLLASVVEEPAAKSENFHQETEIVPRL